MLARAHNSLIKHLIELRDDRKYRAKEKSVVVTGYKLVREVSSLIPYKRLFVASPQDAFGNGEMYLTRVADFKKITGLPSPEPIVAEFSIPHESPLDNAYPLLVLDAVRDPGNLGTLLRTALAFGWKGVFLLPTCVDLFNEKVIRASRAAAFKLPYKTGTWGELEALRQKNQLKAYIADKEGTPFENVIPDPRTLLILSNEAQGINKQAESFGKKITIPMQGDIESLNVAIAGSLLMYYLKAHE